MFRGFLAQSVAWHLLQSSEAEEQNAIHLLVSGEYLRIKSAISGLGWGSNSAASITSSSGVAVAV